MFEIPSKPNIRKVVVNTDTILKNAQPEMISQRDRRAKEA
jgi:ATP-dependent protease Clp ATPase subunit